MKKEKLKHTSFKVVPKKGESVMVFMGRDVEPKHREYKPSQFGIVQNIVTENVTKINKKTKVEKVVGTIEMVYLKECEPINTFDVDFFLPEKRCYFVQKPVEVEKLELA